MRRILLSQKGEFKYSNGDSSRSVAVKKLAGFFEGVENKTSSNVEVTVSNKCINTDKIKQGD